MTATADYNISHVKCEVNAKQTWNVKSAIHWYSMAKGLSKKPTFEKCKIGVFFFYSDFLRLG